MSGPPPDALVWSPGVVVRGHRVASGLGGDPRFPNGTILPQLDAFRRAIPDFDAYLGAPPFAGTINVRLLGGKVTLGSFAFQTGPVRWTEAFPAENFLLSPCVVDHRGARYPAFLYVPDPATKPDHHQAADVMEILAPPVAHLAYGDPIAVGRAGGVFSTGST